MCFNLRKKFNSLEVIHQVEDTEDLTALLEKELSREQFQNNNEVDSEEVDIYIWDNKIED